MTALPGEYAIRGGEVDADRLARQAGVMAAATRTFLARAGLGRGTECLDVGCGQGQVTIEMAAVAGPGTRVVGTDLDTEALQGAARAAAEAGVQVEFLRVDAAEPVAEHAFDLAFCRLVLSHLVDPLAAVAAMRTAVRPGGTVAVEDLLTGTLRSEPPRPVLDELQEVYAATVRARGGDPTIGPRLPALLAAGGLEVTSVRTVANRIESVTEKLFLAELVANMRVAIREAGVADDREIDSLVERTEEAAREPATVFFQAEMYEVEGRVAG